MIDGVLLVNKVVDDIKKKKRKGIIIKLEYEKAYDNVAWSFLRNSKCTIGLWAVSVQLMFLL